MQRSRSDAELPEKAVPSKKVKTDIEIAKAYTVKEEGTYTVILVVEGVKLYVIGEVNKIHVSICNILYIMACNWFETCIRIIIIIMLHCYTPGG